MNLRLITAGVLSKVIKDGQSLTIALERTLEAVDDSKDRAFVQALCYGVVRQYHRLDFILQLLLSKPLRNKESDIKMLILMGLYQLRYMRVKSHAAVSETVTAAKKKSWAKSLINGVLRQYIREQEGLEKQADQQSTAFNSHPQWLIDRINTDWPEQAKDILLENNQQPPMVLRVNLTQNSQQAYLKLLAEQSLHARPVSFCPSAILLEQPVAVEKLPGFSAGLVSVQDTAAQLAAELLDVHAGQTVLDLCAAPGGKTAAILELQNASVSMWAVDIDESRLKRVEENLRRLNLKAKVLVGDAAKPEAWVQGQLFDRILVDAPCSALGVIRRHPDIKVLRRESDISTLQVTQKQILKQAWELLVPGGILLYATCSILKQENEEQIAAFLNNHTDAVELPIIADWGIKTKRGRQVLTGDSGMDGFYYARLVKKGA
ncbi:MAG: 16S rRNA (cytosine(967)-C(5))-methyltransferase RsmB [Methylococcaceae bacterium]|nr:16S rRNA (cytosine(967)-C(5))-methyltransferase RsmB [Methylococcaceae bacterium]